jgi:selenocysteine-specific elongation factor
VLRNPQSAIIVAEDAFQDTVRRVHNLLAIYHKQHPLRRGMSKEEVRSRMSATIPARAFPHLMQRAVEMGAIAEEATTYRTPQHTPSYSPAQVAQVETIRTSYVKSGYSPPSPAELGVDLDVVASLVESGELVKIEDGIYYTRPVLDELRRSILDTIDEHGEINVALMRDLFGTTRKYAIPLLEYFDAQKITRRVGDVRVRW